MPTKRVLDLPAVTSMANNDLFYIVRDSEPTPTDYDKRITWANVLAGLDTRYVPKTFASPQVLTFTGQSQFTFTGAGNFVAADLVGSNAIMLLPNTKQIRFNDNLLDGAASGTYTWTLPSASGTIALTSQIPSVADYIKKDGTTPTTATIPFAVGISVTGNNADGSAIRIPDGSWIRPQTAGQDIYITRGANPSSVNGVLQLNSGGIVLSHGDGTNQLDRLDLGTANTRLAAYSAGGVLLDFLQLGNNNIALVTDAGVGLNATSTMMSMFGSTFLLSASAGDGAYGATGSHKWDSGISGSTAKYQFNGTARFAGQVDFDSNISVGGITATASAIFSGSLTAKPPASITPANNGEMTFQLTSNTQLAIKVKGSDGVVRSTTLTLA